MNLLKNIPLETWNTLTVMAPYLLFGFLVAGLLSVFVSTRTVERHLGGKGVFWQSLKAALFGVPLPLCSCGVIPVTASLRTRGANRASSISFLISTPQTGVDSIMVTLGMLGPVFAIIRPATAFLSGLVGGAVTGLLVPESAVLSRPEENRGDVIGQCDDGCGEKHSGGRIRHAFRHAFAILPRDIGKPLLIGIAIAGLISALVPPNALQAYLGRGIHPMLVMMLVGIPVYVCATASVPVAAALIGAGVSPGAALVFLITGPATNAATVTTIWKLMGRRTTLIYLATVAVSALTAGLLVDHYVPHDTVGILIQHEHAAGYMAYVQAVSAVALLGVILASFRRPRVCEQPGEKEGALMEKTVIRIKGMHCQGCDNAVTQALSGLAGVDTVTVSLDDETAAVGGTNLEEGPLKKKIEELGYTVVGFEHHTTPSKEEKQNGA